MFANPYNQNYMAFNNNYANPYGAYQQPNYDQNQYQQGLIKVTGLEGAKAYQMQPNSVVALFDANNDIFYVKSTDGAGFPTIRAFSFTPYNVEQNHTEYVTRSEFNQLKEMLLNGKQSIHSEQSNEQPVSDVI